MSLLIGQPQRTGLDVALEGVSSGIEQGLNARLEEFNKQKRLKNTQIQLEEAGYPSEFARLMAASTTGGQTAITKELLEMLQRGTAPYSQSVFGPSEDSEDEVIYEESIEEPIGLTPKEKVSRREKQEQRSFERNKKYLDRISSIASELPKEKVALTQMRSAVENGDFNSLRNAVAEMTGMEFLKSASAQSFNAASKQFLMSSLAGLTGRPNQFIERQITRGLINPLYRDAANQIILDGYEGLARLKEREVQLAEELEQKYTSKGIEIPRSFQKLVKEKLKEDAQNFEKEYENKVKMLLGRSVKKGTPINSSVAEQILKEAKGNKELARKIAKKRGYEF
jgi:hypothetical protein